KRDRFLEPAHLAVKRRQQWFAKKYKSWIELHCSFSGGERFVVKAEIAIELARGVVHPQRRRIDRCDALQVLQGVVAIAARGPKRRRKIIRRGRFRIERNRATEFARGAI